ncbi:hypothetical protein QQP08_021861 [Theobroma cacao]|nr:hypothetical protein QQP08_021861 [Theobroma cacao]
MVLPPSLSLKLDAPYWASLASRVFIVVSTYKLLRKDYPDYIKQSSRKWAITWKWDGPQRILAKKDEISPYAARFNVPLLGKKERQLDYMKDVEWAELEQRCVSTIRLCIRDNVFNHVIDEDSSPRLWAKLEKIYLTKSLSNKLQLRRKLYCIKMEDNGDLMKHMNKFDGIIDQLKKVDVKVEEEEKALLFLTSLLDSYEKSKEGDRDPSGLALVTEVRRRKSTDKGSKGGKSRSNNVQCFQCKRYGHIKRNYPTKGDESNQNKGVVGNLTLGNKSIAKVMGLGVVKIKMFDGVVHFLGGVAYVPEMRKNLISLSLLDSKGYGYLACDRVVKVIQCDMVLMRENLDNGLYRLKCEASKGWEQFTGDGSYQSEISFTEKVMKGSHGVDDGERMKNLVSSELEGSSRCWKVGRVRKLQLGSDAYAPDLRHGLLPGSLLDGCAKSKMKYHSMICEWKQANTKS